MRRPVQPFEDEDRSRPADDRAGGAARPFALDEIGALSRETLGERVTDTLRNLLVSGRLAPGEKLSLRSVADSLSVSMTPVREAVARLAADGALEVLPGRAVRVPVLSNAQFEELTRIRIAVEGFAVEEAARNRPDDVVPVVEACAQAFEAASEQEPPDAAGAVSANRDLHFAIYRAAGMPALTEMIERLWLKAGPVLNLDMRDEPRRLRGGRAVQAHAALVAAIRSRDPKAARAALESDIRAAAAHVIGTGRLAAA